MSKGLIHSAVHLMDVRVCDNWQSA